MTTEHGGVLGTIVRFSIRFRGVVIALAILMTGYGVLQLGQAGLDIFPEFAPRAVIIQTEAPGMDAETVAVRVSQVIERAMSGLGSLDHVRSESLQGLSVVTVVFDDATDVYRNRQFVAERLATVASALPTGVRVPVVVPLSSSSATVRTIGIQSDVVDLMTLRDLVDATIVPRLLAVPGVADVNVFGGDVRSLQVRPRSDDLRLHGVAIGDVVAALEGLGGGRALGVIENENQQFALSIANPPRTPAAFADLSVLDAEGRLVRLRDVADIEFGAVPPTSAAQIGGADAIVMMIIGQYGANTLTVSNRLAEVLDGFRQHLSTRGITLVPDLFVPANYIQASLANIGEHILLGGAFVLVVLVVFLFDLRAALISAVAIPLSLLGAAIVLLACGINLNIMVLGGLAIALGEVVDDAIIDTENIYRRLRERRGAPLEQVILDASMEVRGSVVYASFIVVLVFVPLLTLSGVAGRLFAPLGITYILAVLASLGIALTVTPALCAALIGRRAVRADEPPLVRRIVPVYTAFVRRICASRGLPLVAVCVIVVGVAFVLPRFAGQFLPPVREGHYIVHTTGLPGTSLAESIRVGRRLTAEFLAVDGVRSVSQWAGRAERGADTYGSHYSEFEVALAPLDGAAQQQVLEALRGILADYPGIGFEANTFLTERVDETISGYTAPVVVNIYGHDLELLDRKALEVATLMRTLDAAGSVQVRASARVPAVEIDVDWRRVADLGIAPAAVFANTATLYAGTEVGQIAFDDTVSRVLVIADENLRNRADSMRALPLMAAERTPVLLEDVARVRQVDRRYNLLHRSGQRLQAVTAHVEDGDVTRFLTELKSRMATEVALPADMHVEYAGAAVEQAAARFDLLTHSLIAAVGVLLLVYLSLGSVRHVLLVCANLPFALSGGVLAVIVTGASLSLGSIVGFVTLFGITVRNSIMLVSHYRHLVTVEGLPWNAATAARGAAERFPSIVMTTLVTALAMLPIAMNSDNPGREIMGPMAAIVIGGLLSSALLNLLIMPSVMLHYGRFSQDATTPHLS